MTGRMKAAGHNCMLVPPGKCVLFNGGKKKSRAIISLIPTFVETKVDS